MDHKHICTKCEKVLNNSHTEYHFMDGMLYFYVDPCNCENQKYPTVDMDEMYRKEKAARDYWKRQYDKIEAKYNGIVRERERTRKKYNLPNLTTFEDLAKRCQDQEKEMKRLEKEMENLKKDKPFPRFCTFCGGEINSNYKSEENKFTAFCENCGSGVKIEKAEKVS